MLREALMGFCSEVGGGDFISLSKDGLRIELTKGRRSECRFEFLAPSGIRVLASLFYNQRFTRSKHPKSDWSCSYTASFDPDFSIVISPASHPSAKHWLHFDAKYRLERKQAEALFEDEDDVDAAEASANPEAAIDDYDIELARVHKQDDLYKMHTYRDGILGTRGAYVLFPGDAVGGRTAEPSPNLFVRHPSALGASPITASPAWGRSTWLPVDLRIKLGRLQI